MSTLNDIKKKKYMTVVACFKIIFVIINHTKKVLKTNCLYNMKCEWCYNDINALLVNIKEMKLTVIIRSIKSVNYRGN